MTRRLSQKPLYFHFLAAGIGLCLALSQGSLAAENTARRIWLPETPSLSPDGETLLFSWAGEIWAASIEGGNAQRLTYHAARDSQPLFSPDGQTIAFVSDRSGSPQVHLMQADGSQLRQITFHSAGYMLCDWFPDGRSILAIGSRDHYHRDANRLIRISTEERASEKILADATAEDAKVSPDGKRILLTREGERWWRKGYQGERSTQIWLLDLESGDFTELLHEGVECMWPNWLSNGRGFYFTKGKLHGFELWKYRFAKKSGQPGKQNKVTGFDDDSIVYPSVARREQTIVFRHLFDLYRLSPGQHENPVKIELFVDEDVELPSAEMKREISRASAVAFSDDGLDIALIAGGDLWVMDTKLREPKRVTSSAGFEQDPVFSKDGSEIWFTTSTAGQVDVWKATRKDPDKFWWQNHEFDLEQVTHDSHVESKLRFTPDGERLLFQQGRGDLVVMKLDGGEKQKLVRGFSEVDYDISADGSWIAYAQQDENFNSEIWLARLDGSGVPVNVSRHPDNDTDPRFSPDGKLLAFTGRRVDREVDIYYVYLREADDDLTSRQRRIEEAIELMKSKRGKKPAADADDAESKGKEAAEQGQQESEADAKKEPEQQLEIDLDNIHERVRSIPISDSYERGLLFSPDGTKLAFSATVNGKSGWYTVQFPDEFEPKLLTTSTGSQAVWSEAAKGVLYLQDGKPSKLDENGKLESYGFMVAQTLDRSQWLKAGFEQAWLTMREVWYDESFANHNWDAIRRKYEKAAAEMVDTRGLADVIELMLGELNGSHLGFSPSQSSSGASVEGWRDETAHLGVRFEAEYQGPGLLVRDVIKDGPADQETSRLQAGDVILAIDGVAVDPDMDLTLVLNGRLDRDINLSVRRRAEGKEDGDEVELAISLRPISYSRARSLLYENWLEHNRKLVSESSQGKLGYLHIRAMDLGSFHEFERQLYNVGYGRQGLVIDVRDNGGGSTTDLLLTALTQPRHAITVPRGGGQGYPQDRAVFASWFKPIIVLCNQNSYSNAEIFSHAIKTLGRGKVVGVQTAGGVVSTGSASINDVGRIRVPFRGWFLLEDGQDMERNGCLPDVVLWPEPGELPAGIDRQLEKAVELLLEEVGEGLSDRELTYASQRDLESKD
ncbi:MAG: S41 family peptidase [bacterium]|nr:S41 family peptidase [bacterium]